MFSPNHHICIRVKILDCHAVLSGLNYSYLCKEKHCIMKVDN